MVDWGGLLLGQLAFYWQAHLRRRLDGLTDEEYFWEPVAGCWSVRPGGTGTAPIQAGSGEFTVGYAMPEPDPPPVTTIAWRLAHLHRRGVRGPGEPLSGVRRATTSGTTTRALPPRRPPSSTPPTPDGPT